MWLLCPSLNGRPAGHAVHSCRDRINVSPEGRRGYVDSGLYTIPGSFGNLLAGEACIGVGDKPSIGGKVEAPCHLGAVLPEPVL